MDAKASKISFIILKRMQSAQMDSETLLLKYGPGVGSTHKKIKSLNKYNLNCGKAQTGAIAFTKLLARETTNPLTRNYAGALSNAKTAVRLKSQSPWQDPIRMKTPAHVT